MNRDEIRKALQMIFNDIFLDPPIITDDLSASIVEEWDSLLQISLIISVEAEFKIQFMTGEVEETNNIGDFIDLIYKRLIK